jgi:predicted DNA-binding transcriptional regulator AlpA
MDESLKTILAEIRQLRQELKRTREELRISTMTYLTIPEAALLIGWKEKTLQNRLRKRTFPLKSLRNGRRVLFRITDVENNMATLGFVS